MKKKIQELKNEIRKLGSVNVNAIEDYKNVSERYTFLKGQHDDLVEAEASLEQIIEELDVAMRKQFTEQFARIATEFNDVFRQLLEAERDHWNYRRMWIFLRQEYASSHSHLERNCRI